MYERLNGLVKHDMTLETQQDCHKYNARNKDKIKPPKILTNWGRQKFRYQAADDYNSLSNDMD